MHTSFKMWYNLWFVSFLDNLECVKPIKTNSLGTSVLLAKCNSEETDPDFSREAMIYKYRRNWEEILIFPWIYKKKHEFIRILDISRSYIYRYIRTKIEYVYMSPVSTRNMSIQHADAVKCRAMKTNEEKFQRHASPPSLNVL